MPIQEHQGGDFLIPTGKSRPDIDAVHAFLSRSSRVQGVPREIVAGSIAGSLSSGVDEGKKKIGFVRVISDFATYAYLGAA